MRVGRFWRRDWVNWSKVEDRSSVRIDDGRLRAFEQTYIRHVGGLLYVLALADFHKRSIR